MLPIEAETRLSASSGAAPLSQRPVRKLRQKSISTSGSSSTLKKQAHDRSPDLTNEAALRGLELGKLAGLCVNLNRPGMLLDDDVMAEREAKTGSLARRLSREEGVEYFVPDLRRNPRTVIADADLHPVTEIFRRRRKLGDVAVVSRLRFAFGRRVEAVRDKVEQNPCDFLRKDVDLATPR